MHAESHFVTQREGLGGGVPLRRVGGVSELCQGCRPMGIVCTRDISAAGAWQMVASRSVQVGQTEIPKKPVENPTNTKDSRNATR